MKRLVPSIAIATLLVSVVFACESESSSSSGTLPAPEAGSLDAPPSNPDSAVVTPPTQDSAMPTDAPMDSMLTKACDDMPDAGANPACGVVGQCGQLVPFTSDPSDLPVGTSTTLPTGTYVLTAMKAHKVAAPPAQLKMTVRLLPDLTYQRIEAGELNGEPVGDRRESGTYSVAGGKFTLTEVCPNPSVDTPVTFTVSGNTVTLFLPQGGGGPGQGISQTFALFL